MGNTKEYPENVWNIVLQKGVTQHHTRLHISNTSNNPQPQKRTKNHNTQRSPNLGTQKQLSHACYAHNYIINNWERQKRLTSFAVLKGIALITCWGCKTWFDTLHSALGPFRGLDAMVYTVLCLSSWPLRWYMHSINVYTIHIPSYFFNYLVFITWYPTNPNPRHANLI